MTADPLRALLALDPASLDVDRFIEAVHVQGVVVQSYVPNEVGAWLKDPTFLERANLLEVRSVLTWIARGERFGEGHVAHCVADGTLGRALARLATLLGPEST